MTIKNAYQRKKQPEIVRQKILDSAMQLAADKGVASISIQAVATLADVTKGGVFHHFANKQILIEAMLSYILTQLDEELAAMIAKDPIAYGCFTRAYIELTLTHTKFGVHSLWAALSMTLLTEQSFSTLWNDWLAKNLTRYATTDMHMDLKILRYAADGIWFIERLDPQKHIDFVAVKEELIRKSYMQS